MYLNFKVPANILAFINLKNKAIIHRMSNKNDSTKWIAILGLVIAFSTYYFNVYLHAPNIVYTEVKCPKIFEKYSGELITISFTNYGDGATRYKLTLIGNGVGFKKSNMGTHVSREEFTKNYKSKLEFTYVIGPKVSNSFTFHIFANESSQSQIGYTATLEYDTFPLFPIPLTFRHVKYTILDCRYILNPQDSQYYLAE